MTNLKNYSWIPFFKEFCQKLLAYENHQKDLVQILQDLSIVGMNDRDGDNSFLLQEIDPFTFIACLHKFGDTRRIQLANEVGKTLGLQIQPITDVKGVPTAQPQRSWFFPYKSERKDTDIPLLWTLFKEALTNKVSKENFENVLKIKTVGKTKLTQGLFWVNPENFLPIDAHTKPYLGNLSIKTDFDSWEEYQSILLEVKDKIKKSFYEISDLAYQKTHESQQEINISSLKSPQMEVSTVTEIQNMVNHFIINQPKRRLYLEIFLEIIIYTNSLGTNKWGIHLGEDKTVRFLVGNLIMTTFHLQKEAIWMALDEKLVETAFDEIKTILEPNWDLGKWSKYVAIPTKNYFYRDSSKEIWNKIKYLHFEAIKKASEKYEWLKISSQKSHSNDFIEYLSEELNTFVPNPSYVDSIVLGNRINNSLIGFNKILFGSPGTGKSYKTRELTQGKISFTTTFHPEYDYANFVGAYKPTSEGEMIRYQFVPQVFTKAYIAAWKNLSSPHILVIEEINRGNCAAIFGDIFQLLDRDEQGFSEYFIDIDTDLASFLEVELADTDYEIHIKDLYNAKKGELSKSAFSVMCLPNNLSLLATMNTSDQSLFPMDSAFKRRWEWEYLPIDYAKAETIGIQIGDKKYSWADFLRKVNHKIYQIIESEDKQIGVWFAKPKENIISEAQFLNKVMFYLWFDVFKNEDNAHQFYIFKIAENQLFKYADLFSDKNLITQFIDYHQIQEFTA
jgi:hypothetical protein